MDGAEGGREQHMSRLTKSPTSSRLLLSWTPYVICTISEYISLTDFLQNQIDKVTKGGILSLASFHGRIALNCLALVRGALP